MQLSPEEEAWLLHTGPLPLSRTAHTTPPWERFGAYAAIGSLRQLPIDASFVHKAEATLAALVQQPQKPHAQQLPAFPLPPLLDGSVPVAMRMMDELRDSWECYQQHPAPDRLIPGALRKLSTGPYTLVSAQ